MKRHNSMNFLVRLSLLSVLISFTQFVTAQNKDFLKEGVYFDNQAYNRSVENTIYDLLKNSNAHLDTTQAKKQLKEKAGAVVAVQKLKPLTKPLNAKEMVQHLRKRTVAFSSVYDCGNCNRTHINPASGYIIDQSGLIVTNHHVVESFTTKSNN